MAIDSAAKRLSAIQAGAETTTAGMPLAVGAIGAASRATMMWLYSGIAISTPAVPVGGEGGNNYGRGGGFGRWGRNSGYQK